MSTHLENVSTHFENMSTQLENVLTHLVNVWKFNNPNKLLVSECLKSDRMFDRMYWKCAHCRTAHRSFLDEQTPDFKY